MRNFEFRFAFGQLPFSSASESGAGIWLRTAKRRRPDAFALAAFTDAWAPMPFTQLDRPAGAPTLDLTIHFRDHGWYERAADDAFVLASFRSQLLAEGLFEEDGELWSDDGVLLAQSRQLAMFVE
jgi:acyl-CoA thioesterase